MKLEAKERRWLGIASLGVVLLTSLPYLVAFLSQGENWYFSGFLIGVEDGNSYIAKMLRGAQGDWLFRSPYSTLPQTGALLYWPYLLLGKLIGPSASHQSYLLTFHIFRLFSNLALCFATYVFIARIVKQLYLRRAAWLIALLGGGLGWLLIAAGQSDFLGSIPLEFYSPESFGFLALFTFPHLSLGRALMLLALLIYLAPMEATHSEWQTTLLWLALALVHILSAGIALLLVGSHWLFTRLWCKRPRTDNLSELELGQLLWPVLGAGFPLLYNLVVFVHDPYLPAWSQQNLIVSPHPLHYLLAYGLLLPFAWLGARALRSRQTEGGQFLAHWLILAALLLLIPFGLQRGLAEGIWVAIVVLAVAAFDGADGLRLNRWRWSLAAVFPSTLMLLAVSAQFAAEPRPPAFLESNLASALEGLEGFTDENDVILAPFELGNTLPAFTPLRVVIGHGPESVGLDNLQGGVEGVLDGQLSQGDLAFLNAHQVRFVLAPEMIHDSAAVHLIKTYPQAGLWLYAVNP